ncbi:dynein assembly factor 4, axonemal [Mugil cephalus]|uniref:dynein assembly factor 4, axonemal n=1 Tax=Mugil cephalus TaxID=48193 RepID=UPI001FB78520|nr:dynein assembly factor 4, axonemal [Mugil cephalus]
MPLLVSDFSWTQTDSMIYINVPLKGAKAAKVDIVSTDEYLKVHFPPYLFEAFLSEPVDDDRSTARIGNGAAVISLAKRTNKVWEQLMITTNDKEQQKEVRHRALLRHQDKLSSASRQEAEKQQAERRFALETMMKIEREERENVQRMKDAERERTTAELVAWRLRQNQEAEPGSRSQSLNQQRDGTKGTETGPPGGGRVRPEQKGKSDEKKKETELPPPRPSGNIHITFTPRVFPTALRESRVQEEDEWLRKEAESRRSVNADMLDLKELKEEERNPDWLKDRGDQRFRAGDFLGAVNAYSLAIRLNGNIPALHSNRAACHLKLRNLHKAVQDSTQALDLLTPPVAANAAARMRASVRRGTAFCQLQLYAEGLQDFQAALRIEPDNASLQEDVQRIRDIVQGSNLTDHN